MSEKICIAETKKELDILYQSKKSEDKFICLPLNLETYLYCTQKNIKFIDPYHLINNTFHKKILVEGEKFVDSIHFKKKLSKTLILEIKSILRFRFYSVLFLSELVSKILMKHKSISLLIVKKNTSAHSVNPFLVDDILTNLFPELTIEKKEINYSLKDQDDQHYSYKIETKTNKNKKNILLNNLGYNFKRIVLSKLFNFNYKFYTFENNKISFLKKIIFKLLRVEIINLNKTKDNFQVNSLIEKINYNFINKKIHKTILVLLNKLQIHFSNFNNKTIAINSFLKTNPFSLILTNMVKGEGGIIVENPNEKPCPTVCISHGTVAEKFNDHDEIYKKIIASAVFGGSSKYFAIQSKIAEKSLNTHKINGKKILTGNILFSEKRKKNLVLKKKYILFAVTLKKFYNLQFLGVEMFYEFIRNLNILERFSKQKKIKVLVKIHPSEANCIKSLRSLYPNLLFTNKPVDNLFQKCFVTISYSSSVIEDSLNSRVPVILFDQWKRYMHCKSNLTERNAIYYINTYDSLCESVDKILRVKDFDFNEFVFEGYSKDNINKKIFTLINK